MLPAADITHITHMAPTGTRLLWVFFCFTFRSFAIFPQKLIAALFSSFPSQAWLHAAV